MTQETRLISLANAIGADIKAVKATAGDLTALPTTNKTSLVAAITEIYGLMGTDGAAIDDLSGDGATAVTWSANKISDSIEAAKTAVKSELLGGASAAYDTFVELQALLEADETLTASLSDAITKRVRFDAPQTLTVAQQLQACTNIGIGNPDTDFVAAYNTAKA